MQGAGGAAPAGGTACPPVPKNVGGWSGRDSGAGQARPSEEGGRTPQQNHPSRLCHHPLAISEQLCYSIPMKSADSPLLLLGACRIHEHWGLTTENPPVAGALREQPKGQDPPRKVGTGANAVVRHRLPGAISLHYDSLRFHYSSLTVPLRLVTPYYASVTAPRLQGAGGEEKTIKERGWGRGQLLSSCPGAQGKVRMRPLARTRIAVRLSQLVQRFPRGPE